MPLDFAQSKPQSARFAPRVPIIAAASCKPSSDRTFSRLLRLGALGIWLAGVFGCQHLSAPTAVAPPAAEVAAPQPVQEVAAAAEPIPAATASEPVAPASLLDRLRASFRLDRHLDRSAVRRRVEDFADHPERFWPSRELLLEYLPYVCAQVQARDMPGELCLLPVVESGLDIRASSSAGAVGLWQFMPQTARRYGLRIDRWVDERRDVVRSTSAALDYLTDLHDRLGDWLLAIAAYNCGGGRVDRAVATAGASSAPDLYDLRLPAETLAHTDKLLAMAAAVAAADRFGVPLPLLPTDRGDLTFTVVTASRQLDLASVAAAVGRNPGELRQRNPALKSWVTHPAGPHHLIVDVADADAVESALAADAPPVAVAWQPVRIVAKDTLIGLARRYGTDVDTLRSINNITGSLIRIGDDLLVPARR